MELHYCAKFQGKRLELILLFICGVLACVPEMLCGIRQNYRNDQILER